jgi:hypothetical protein
LASLVIFLGMGLLAAEFIFPFVAFAFASCLSIVLNAMVAIIFLCSKIPFAYIYLSDVRTWHIIIYYAALSLVIFSPWKRLLDDFKAMFLKIFPLGKIDKRLRV